MCNMSWLKDSEQNRAQRFNCSVEQLRAHYGKNAQVLREMLTKAETTGKKVNGYTAQQLRDMVTDHEKLAKGGY